MYVCACVVCVRALVYAIASGVWVGALNVEGIRIRFAMHDCRIKQLQLERIEDFLQ